MEKLKNENSKKRPPQAPTPHQYPGIYRIYEYGLHKASGVQEIGKKTCVLVFYSCYRQKALKSPVRIGLGHRAMELTLCGLGGGQNDPQGYIVPQNL